MPIPEVILRRKIGNCHDAGYLTVVGTVRLNRPCQVSSSKLEPYQNNTESDVWFVEDGDWRFGELPLPVITRKSCRCIVKYKTGE